MADAPGRFGTVALRAISCLRLPYWSIRSYVYTHIYTHTHTHTHTHGQREGTYKGAYTQPGLGKFCVCASVDRPLHFGKEQGIYVATYL